MHKKKNFEAMITDRTIEHENIKFSKIETLI